MNKFKRVSAVVLAGTTFVLMPGESHGLGFGRPSSHAILGEPLRVKVPIRFETGEDTDGGCYAAEVLFGEDKVSPDSVSVIVVSSSGSERVLRITTTKLINEPLVTVTVSAGCLGRVSRTYSVFADPPGMTLPNAAEPPPGRAGRTAQLPLRHPADGPVGRCRCASRSASCGQKTASAGGACRGEGADPAESRGRGDCCPHGTEADTGRRVSVDAPSLTGPECRAQADPRRFGASCAGSDGGRSRACA